MPAEVEEITHGVRSAGNILTSPLAKERLTLMEVWRVLIKRRFVILTVTVLAVAGSVWYALHTTPVYESIGRIEIRPEESPNLGIEQIIERTGTGQETNALQTEVRILQSDSVLFQTAQNLGVINRVRRTATSNQKEDIKTAPASDAEIAPAERRAMIAFIRSGLTVTILQGTNLVEIRYRNSDPALSAAIVNQLFETYSDEDLRSKYERTMHVSTWLQRQLEGLKGEASDAQRELADYQKAHNIVGTDEDSNLTLQTLQNLSSTLNDAETDRIMKESRMHEFDSLNPNLVALMGDNPTLTALRSQLADLQRQRALLSTKYGPKYPKILDLQSQIDNTQREIDAEVALARRQVNNEYEGALGVEQALQKRLGAQEETAYKLNEGAARYAILRNQAELTRDLYDTLQVRLKEATVTAGLSAANITVVDSAQVPYLPVAPRKRLSMLLGLLGGLLGGCVLAFLFESVDDRMQTSDEVESVTSLPSLAAIPRLAGETEIKAGASGREDVVRASRFSRQLVALRDSESNGAEAYRRLRTSLLLSSIDNPPRIIVITSAFPGEGKTTTAINTAIVLAQRGEKVLLVDADLRKGTLSTAFGISDPTFGLSTILTKSESDWDIPTPLPDLPTLHVIPTGPRPPNPAEMLSSSRMAEQLRQWADKYERIVLDSAPLLAVSDTQSLAVLADTVVLVTRARMTRKRALLRARDILQRINAPIAGVVVNDVDIRLEHFYTYRYGMYGGYGYGYGGRYGSPYSDKAYGYEKDDKHDKEVQ